jgi:AcrR family transcriptional regulator
LERIVVPPKIKYSKEDVIRAAVAVVEDDGLNLLTARSVAARLGSSTAPVYHYFAAMDDLARSVIMETKRALLEYTSRPYTDRVFLNMGTGVAMFACEHRRLYRALLLEGGGYGDVVQDILDTLESAMTADTRFTSLSSRERHVLLRKMWTFTHGLASQICVGLIKNCDQNSVVGILTDVGADVIGATLAKHERETRGGQPRKRGKTKA